MNELSFSKWNIFNAQRDRIRVSVQCKHTITLQSKEAFDNAQYTYLSAKTTCKEVRCSEEEIDKQRESAR